MALDDIAAVILYDEIAFGIRAKDVCDRLALELSGDVELRVGLWRSDLLKSSIGSNLALADAAGADLVVLALRRTKLLSKLVWEWLENWASAKHVEDAALVVLAEETEGVLSPVAAHQLQRFALSHGLNCFCESEQTQVDQPLGALGGSERLPHATHSHLLPPIPERPDEYAHWGIND